jgi:hypothetical protein
MGLGQTHKQKFKMKSTYITKKIGLLMQVEWKWCGEFSRGNLKHKFYTIATFGRRHHSPPYNIFCASTWGQHPNVTFCRSLSLGFTPKARVCEGVGQEWSPGVTFHALKSEVQESHFMLSRVWESVKEWTSTFPSELPLWESWDKMTFEC